MERVRSKDLEQGRKLGKGRVILFAFVALSLSVGSALVLAEIVLRIFLPQPASWMPIYRTTKDFPFYVNQANLKHHVYTGETDWTIETDSRGFRFDPSASTEGQCQALWLGDSFIFGNGVNFEESLVGYMNDRSPAINHLDAGVSGHGPAQYSQILSHWIEQGLDLDRVFVATFLGNDFHDMQWDKNVSAVDGLIGNEGGLDSFLKQHLHLRRLMANIYHSIAPRDRFAFVEIADDLANPSKWEEDFLTEALRRYEVEMRKLRDRAMANGFGFAVLVLPPREAVGYLRSLADGHAASADRDPLLPIKKATAVLKGLGIPYLDAVPLLATAPLEEVFFRFDGHLTARGNALVGEAFLEQVGRRCSAVMSNEES